MTALRIPQRYDVKKDPYSDHPSDFVVWDGETWQMPFQGTRQACWRYVRALDNGHDHYTAERLAIHGGAA